MTTQNRMTACMSNGEYLAHVHRREQSFARPKANLDVFRGWIATCWTYPEPCPFLPPDPLFMLSYLVWEHIGLVMDVAICLRERSLEKRTLSLVDIQYSLVLVSKSTMPRKR